MPRKRSNVCEEKRSTRKVTKRKVPAVRDGCEKASDVQSGKETPKTMRLSSVTSRRKGSKSQQNDHVHEHQLPLLPVSLTDLPAGLQDKVENMITELSNNGYDSMMVVVDISTKAAAKTGSNLGKQFLEMSEDICLDFFNFCQENNTENPKQSSDAGKRIEAKIQESVTCSSIKCESESVAILNLEHVQNISVKIDTIKKMKSYHGNTDCELKSAENIKQELVDDQIEDLSDVEDTSKHDDEVNMIREVITNHSNNSHEPVFVDKSEDMSDKDDTRPEAAMETSTDIPEKTAEKDSEYSLVIEYLTTEPNAKSEKRQILITNNSLEKNVKNVFEANAKDEEFDRLATKVAQALKNMGNLCRLYKMGADGQYECSFCDKKWKTKSIGLRHYRTHLEIFKRPFHMCDICYSILPRDFMHLHKATHNFIQNYLPDCFTWQFTDIRNDVVHFMLYPIKTNEKVICRYCSEEICGNNYFKKHLMLHHTIQYECKECGVDFSDYRCLSKHAILHKNEQEINGAKVGKNIECSDEGSFMCMFCNKSYKVESALYWHMDDKHPDPIYSKYHCKVCNKFFKGDSILQLHLRNHNKTYTCPYEGCSKQFSSRILFNSHKRNHTKAKYRKLCNICGNIYHNNYQLKQHMEFKHLGKEPLKCDYCPSTFLSIDGYSRHIKVHTAQDNIICEFCGDVFKTITMLYSHRKYKHKTKIKHKCVLCQTEFNKYASLEIHLFKENHFTDQQPKTLIKFKNCGKCGKKFINSRQVASHTRSHHKEPRKCSYCGKYFKDKSNLRKHIMAHENTQPRCQHCNMIFRSTVKLNEHLNAIHPEFQQLLDTSFKKPNSHADQSYAGSTGLTDNVEQASD